MTNPITKEILECEHEIGRRAIGGFAGHEHTHPTGNQYCFNCGKYLKDILKEAYEAEKEERTEKEYKQGFFDGKVSDEMISSIRKMKDQTRQSTISEIIELLPEEKELGIKDRGVLRIERALNITGQNIGFNSALQEIKSRLEKLK